MHAHEAFSIDLYDYHLPAERIAQRPLARRDESRLLVLDRETGDLRHEMFCDIPRHFGPGDLLVVNNSKVIPARIYGVKPSGGKVEMLLLSPVDGNGREGAPQPWKCLLRAAGRIREGFTVSFGPLLTASVSRCLDDGVFEVELTSRKDLFDVLSEIGHIPLPPYIRRPDESNDFERYQTVYAERFGSVASPTAGLHMTPELLRELEDRGVERVSVTLHVGLGTFRPLAVEDVRRHTMHSEVVEISPNAALQINDAKREGKRIVALGTTTVRVLEWMGSEGRVRSGREECDLFIFPGFRFRMVDAMITNFHQPRSSLLLLCSAFAGRDRLLSAYHEAVRLGYRFLSYGDATLLL